jgi:hypothetical protein
MATSMKVDFGIANFSSVGRFGMRRGYRRKTPRGPP